MHPHGRFDAGFELHFLQQMFHMDFHRALGDIEATGDHLIRQTLGDMFQDIALAGRQLGDVAVRGARLARRLAASTGVNASLNTISPAAA